MTIASTLSDLWRGAFEAPPPPPQAQELQKSPGGIGLSVYTNKAISSYRRHLRQIATAAFNLRTWDSDTRIGIVNISSATESNRIAASRLKTNYLDISICALLHVLK